MTGEKTDQDIVEGEVVGRGDTPGDDTPPDKASVPARLPWILFAGLLIFISGLFAYPWVEVALNKVAPDMLPAEAAPPPEPSPEILNRLDSLDQKSARLEQRLSLAEQEAESSDHADRLADIVRRLAVLENTLEAEGDAQNTTDPAIQQRLDELEQRLVNMPEAGTQSPESIAPELLANIETRLNAIEDRQAGSSQRAETVLTLSRLERQTTRGAPYMAELTAFRAVRSEEIPVPAILQDHAGRGLPTLEDLTERYPDAARAAQTAGTAADAGWLSRTFAKLKGVVTVRKVGEQQGSAPEAILSRAEVRLSEGDLAAALAELERLPDANRAAMADWLADATMTQEVGQAFILLWKAVREAPSGS